MSKVNHEKSETKKKGGENMHSFVKNTSNFHEDINQLHEAATSPVEGAFGNNPSKDLKKTSSMDSTNTATDKDSKHSGKSK